MAIGPIINLELECLQL